MLNQIFAITVKEFKVLTHDRGALSMLFLMPIAFILIMTVALQNLFNTGSSDHPISVLVVNADQGKLAQKVIADLRSLDGLQLVEQQNDQPLDRQDAEALITSGKYSLAVVFPADFSASIQAAAADPSAGKSMVSFIIDPTLSNQILSPVKGIVQGTVEREASLAQAPQRTALGFDRMAAQAPGAEAQTIRAIGVQYVQQVASAQNPVSGNLGVAYQVVTPASYHAVREPSSAEQNVPGYTIYGVFFIMQTIASGIFREKNEGTFRRLQAAPISRAALLTGKLLPYYLINLIQIALMFAVGVVIFHINLGNDPLALIPLSLATAAAATGLGLLVTTLGKTAEQVGSLSTLLAIILSALGGSMVPVSVMPGFMQHLSLITPHAWALTGFQDIIVRGLGMSAVFPIIAVLLAFAVAFWGFGLLRFQFE